MHHHKSELYFLLAILTGVFVLVFFVFKPFLYALILAMVFTTVFAPIHKKLLVLTHENKGLSALLSTIAVLIVVIVPITLIGAQVFQEATQLYMSLIQNGGAAELTLSIKNIVANLQGIFPATVDVSADVNQYVEQGLNWLIQHLGPLFKNVAIALLDVFVFLVALYYLFKDGQKFKEEAIKLSPLQDVHDETIADKLSIAVNSVIKGSLAVAFVQGVLATIGLLMFGVPNAALWGSVAALTALIPGIGTSLVLIPAIVYLVLHGEIMYAIGLLLWGMLVVGMADNVLRPIIVERGVKLHPFLILLSILGGIGLFGPIGFLLGPLVLSLLFVLLEIYLSVQKEHKVNQ